MSAYTLCACTVFKMEMYSLVVSGHIMAALIGHDTIKFNSDIFNHLRLLLQVH